MCRFVVVKNPAIDGVELKLNWQGGGLRGGVSAVSGFKKRPPSRNWDEMSTFNRTRQFC